MGLFEGRSDKAAIALEQPHRGTAATPLATAILNRRHGQGAVPSRLLKAILKRAEIKANEALQRANQARDSAQTIAARNDIADCLSAIEEITKLAGCSDELVALKVVAQMGPEKALKAAHARAAKIENADFPSYELAQLLNFYDRVADDPTAKDTRLRGEKAQQKTIALTLMQSVIAGCMGTDETHFVSAFINALYAAGSRKGRTADEVLRSTGLSGPPVDPDMVEVVLDIRHQLIADQSFTGINEEQAKRKLVAWHAGELFADLSDDVSAPSTQEVAHEIRRTLKGWDKSFKEKGR